MSSWGYGFELSKVSLNITNLFRIIETYPSSSIIESRYKYVICLKLGLFILKLKIKLKQAICIEYLVSQLIMNIPKSAV